MGPVSFSKQNLVLQVVLPIFYILHAVADKDVFEVQPDHESTEQIESSVRLVFLSLFRLGFLCMGVVMQFILCNLS